MYSALVIYLIHSINSVYMSVPITQFFPPLFPLLVSIFCSLPLCLYFCFVDEITYTIFFLFFFFGFHMYVLIYNICFSDFTLYDSL